MPGAAPVDLLHWFTADDLARGAARMAVVQTSTSIELVLDTLLLLAFAFGPPGVWLHSKLRAWLRLPPGTLTERLIGADGPAGAAFLATLAALRALIAFPTSFHRDFVQARALGLSHEGLLSFLRRFGTDLLLAAIALAILGAVIAAVRRWSPKRWWLVVGCAGALALLADAVAEPLWSHIDYDVKTLTQGPLRTRVEALLSAHATDAGDIVVLDASRYGTSANAFVTGAGPTRRLVLTDTLIDMGDEAVLGAVAHEIGHRRGERLPIRLAFACVGLVVFLYFVERTLRFALKRGAGCDARAVAFLLVAVTGLNLLLSPIRASFSRDEEREADRLELSVRRDHAAYIESQVALVRANASHPHPPFFVRIFGSHPTPAERIAEAIRFADSLPADALPVDPVDPVDPDAPSPERTLTTPAADAASGE